MSDLAKTPESAAEGNLGDMFIYDYAMQVRTDQRCVNEIDNLNELIANLEKAVAIRYLNGEDHTEMDDVLKVLVAHQAAAKGISRIRSSGYDLPAELIGRKVSITATNGGNPMIKYEDGSCVELDEDSSLTGYIYEQPPLALGRGILKVTHIMDDTEYVREVQGLISPYDFEHNVSFKVL